MSFMVRLDLDHIHIKVRDLNRTLSFYQALGFHIGKVPSDGGEYVYIGLDKGSIDPSLSPGRSDSKEITIGVAVDDVEEVYRRAKACEAEIVDEIKDRSWGVRSFYIRDPDDYMVEFEQEK